MADFKIAFKKTVGNEGDYDNHSDDRGNWNTGVIGVGVLAGTKYGITCWEVGEFLKRPMKSYTYVNSNKQETKVSGYQVSADDVKNFSLENAQAIYKKKYWDIMRGDEINDQDYANTIFDFGVNTGISNGIGKWQSTIGVPATKKMDEVTLKKTNELL